MSSLTKISTKDLLVELSKRGGPEAQLAKAGLLRLAKAEDYNRGPVDLDMYFPFGMPSYAQMMHIKTMRINSLVSENSETRFESLQDTVLDLINYASFSAEFLSRQGK